MMRTKKIWLSENRFNNLFKLITESKKLSDLTSIQGFANLSPEEIEKILIWTQRTKETDTLANTRYGW